jgi:hypothetical protein
MKIAIPTDDGIMLSANAKNPKGYLILQVAGGEIINEELRWNKSAEILAADNEILSKIVDCSVIIVNSALNGFREYYESKQIEIITTREVIITRIIMEYLNVTLLRESNTCCSP